MEQSGGAVDSRPASLAFFSMALISYAAHHSVFKASSSIVR